MRSRENKDMDNILRQALTPSDEPGEMLNRQVLQRVQEQMEQQRWQEPNGKKRLEKRGKCHKAG